jgi:hypothetical protein
MNIYLNFEEGMVRIKKYVVVIVMRSNKKEKILYNSGLQYFYTEASKNLYVRSIKEKFKGSNLEVHDVDIYQAHAPESDTKVRGKYWCPYCQGYHKYKKDGYSGYLRCEICGMSDGDFYVKTYNHLWSKTGIKTTVSTVPVENKSTKKRRVKRK